MGYYCTVPQCTSLAGKTKNVKFHRFPRDITMADKWNIILKRGKPYTKYSKVCSLHFTQADYNVTTMGQWKTLSKDAVPSQNLPKLNPDGSVMVIRKSRTVKYREGKKDDSDKTDKSWQNAMATHGAHPLMSNIPETTMASQELHDNSILAYKLQTLEGIANNISPQQLNSLPLPHGNGSKPKKQDAFMQTDPVQNEDDDTQPNNSYSEIPDTIKINAFMQTDPIQNEDDDTQPNNSYSEVSDKSYSSEVDQYNQSCPKDSSPYPKDLQYREQTPFAKDYPKESSSYRESPYKEPSSFNRESAYKDNGYSKDGFTKDAFPKEFKDDAYNKTYELNNYEPKDYTKTSDDYIPQTNEEYNKEAEKYALVRKSHNGYDLKGYQKQLENYPKLPVTDMYSIEKYNRDPYYQYPDSVEVLRNQQHNLQILQEQHRINENRNFFNENHIKQEIDISADDDKFMYERNKEQLESSPMYAERRLQEQRFLEHIQQQVKQEPDTANGETTMQPQGSPYYPHLNTAAHGYYEALPRPGPELLIAKQNALAAQTQLWQNTMKRPFFFNETAHYNGALLQHRYDDIPRILQ